MFTDDLPTETEDDVPSIDQYASPEYEQALLGDWLNGANTDVVANAQVDDFWKLAHREIFVAIETLHKSNSPIDTVTVSQVLKDRGKLDQVGGRGYITDLSLSRDTTTNTAYYVKELRRKRVERELRKVPRMLNKGVTPEAAMQRIEALIKTLEPEQPKERQAPREPEQITCENELLTETYAKDRFVAEHKLNLRFTSGRSGRWYWWSGKYWKQVPHEFVRSLVEKTNSKIVDDLWEQVTDKKALRSFQNKMMNRRGLDNTVELSKSDCEYDVLQFDTNPYLLNFENGTVELNVYLSDDPTDKTENQNVGSLREHRRSDNCSKILPYDFDPEAKCPEWNSFLEIVFAESIALIQYIWRCIGYSLTGSTKEQVFFFCYGKSGRNGKTTFLETLLYVLGSYGRTADKRLITDRGQDTKAGNPIQVLGARYLPIGEVNDKDKIDETALKNCTGEDTLTGAWLYEETITFKSLAKVWLRGNEKPRVRATDSVFRRVSCIPFNVRASDEQVEKYGGRLGDVLRRERQGIMAKAIRACIEWQNIGGLFPPSEVEETNAEYRKEMDFFGQAIGEVAIVDECHEEKEIDDLNHVGFKELQSAMNKWSRENEYHPWNRHRLQKDLVDHGFKGPKPQGGYPHYYGLKLRPEWEPTVQGSRYH
ncbi:MAG: phage/plasmid primase, P4 family [Ktedonobacteraceae bacterium]